MTNITFAVTQPSFFMTNPYNILVKGPPFFRYDCSKPTADKQIFVRAVSIARMLLRFYASDTRKIAYQSIYISLTLPYAADCYYAFRAVAIFVSPNMRQITDVQYAETGTITNSILICRQVFQYDKLVL
jgi:hypothetical protein